LGANRGQDDIELRLLLDTVRPESSSTIFCKLAISLSS
jgi:hypothetical protein